MMILDSNLIYGTHGMSNTDNDKNKNYLFSIIVPVYNEEKIILKSAKLFYKVVTSDYQSSLIFVNDGSDDNTLKILKKISSSRVRIISHKKNKGYGSALLSGIDLAVKLNSKYVLFMDSDLTNDLDDILKFKKFMLLDYDLIKASRYEKIFNKSKIPFKRYIFSFIGNLFFRLYFFNRITDATNGFRAVKTIHYKNIKLFDNGFSIIVEELFKFKNLRQFKIKNIPVILGTRSSEIKESSFSYNFTTIFSYAKFLLKIFK